jgi:hypothetical protein
MMKFIIAPASDNKKAAGCFRERGEGYLPVLFAVVQLCY